MKTYWKAYRFYLKSAAKGIFLFPKHFYWGELWRELSSVAGSLLVLMVSIFFCATYPVSVFILAALSCEADRQTVAKRKKYFAERQARNGGGCLEDDD